MSLVCTARPWVGSVFSHRMHLLSVAGLPKTIIKLNNALQNSGKLIKDNFCTFMLALKTLTLEASFYFAKSFNTKTCC